MALYVDSDLVTRAVAGERDALGEIVAAASPYVQRQLLRYPLTDDDRNDLLQTTLMQVLRRLGSFRGASSFSTWLFRVTANEALMLMRSQRRFRARIAPEHVMGESGAIESRPHEGAEPDVQLASHEARALVQHALAELPDDYRDVVVAHYHDELGLQEIASQLHITESAVRSRLHRARARLRTLLEAA